LIESSDSELIKERCIIRNQNQRWDIFCNVVDNFGDIGICWRLARQLSDEYHVQVRLWVDRLDSFACLCPSVSTELSTQSFGSIEICRWDSDFLVVDVADVVIEAFACNIPQTYLNLMNHRAVAPVWINLEYLSAEAWVEECHCLTSPQFRSQVKKHFFFPGFTRKTGGLLRERSLLDGRAAFDEAAVAEFWREPERFTTGLKSNNVDPGTNDEKHIGSNIHNALLCKNELSRASDNEIHISLFCYDNPALPELLKCWANGHDAIRTLVSPGAATEQVARWLGKELTPGIQIREGVLTVQAIPFLSQSAYDQLLWACDVNFVRGEDSFIRAQWAQRPFVWQIYPQAKNGHFTKLNAFLSRYLSGFDDSDSVRHCFHAWNGTGSIEEAWRKFVVNRRTIQQHGKVWVSELDRAGNLADNLVRFVCGEYTARGGE
jgi:hypothetical protein